MFHGWNSGIHRSSFVQRRSSSGIVSICLLSTSFLWQMPRLLAIFDQSLDPLVTLVRPTVLQQEDQVGRALSHRKEIYQLSGYLYWLRHLPKQDDRIALP